MFRVVLVAALLASAIATPCEDIALTYRLNTVPPMETVAHFLACPETNTITSNLAESESFDAVRSMEDYDAGFVATVVEEQEACFINKLRYTDIQQQIDELKSTPVVDIEAEARDNLISIPVEDTAAEFGERLSAFCGDFPVYKVGTTSEGSELEQDMSDNERTLTLTFRKCCTSYSYYTGRCTYYTFTFPTGTTITFFWFG